MFLIIKETKIGITSSFDIVKKLDSRQDVVKYSEKTLHDKESLFVVKASSLSEFVKKNT